MTTSPAKSGIEGAVTRWDEVIYGHLVQSNFMHRVVRPKSNYHDILEKSHDTMPCTILTNLCTYSTM